MVTQDKLRRSLSFGEMHAKPRVQAPQAGYRVTLAGILVNVVMIVFKFIAGIFGHSQALIADAVHSVSDLFTDAVVLIGLKVGRRAPDAGHPFGHARIETMASAAVGLTLITVALYIGIKAAWNIYYHREYHPTWLALIAAGFSIVVKEALYQYTVHIGRHIKSLVVVANAWHHRSDALSSVAVLLGVIGAQIRDEWHILDAFAALVVSFFILKISIEILWDTVREFTDTAPGSKVLDKITHATLSIDGVIGIHDLKVRTSGGLYQMELHIVVNGGLTVAEGHRIAKAVEHRLSEEIEEFGQIIIHVDPLMQK